jgi:hypothetical protein
MSIEPTTDWSPDLEIASLLEHEREDAGPGGAGASARVWHRLELHAVGAAAAGVAIAGGLQAMSNTDAASKAVSTASGGVVKALAWKIGGASLLLVAGGAIGASVEARFAARAGAPVVAPAPSAATQNRDEAPGVPSSKAPDDGIPTVDVQSLPRVPPTLPAVVTRVPSPSVSASASATEAPTSLGEEQRLLDTARTAVARGAYSSALTSLTEHETRFPSGRLTEERELLFVQALAGKRDMAAARARGSAFAARFPGSIFLPVVRALTASPDP